MKGFSLAGAVMHPLGMRNGDGGDQPKRLCLCDCCAGSGGAGWHSSPRLKVPDNIVLLPLPPYSPEWKMFGSFCAATLSP
jgi:hypothetical protein